MTREETLHRAIETFGVDAQMIKTVEEMAELAQVIAKYAAIILVPIRFTMTESSDKTFFAHRDTLNAKLREEMADVRIMLEQMEIIFGDTSEIQDAKLAQLTERMDEMEEQQNDEK